MPPRAREALSRAVYGAPQPVSELRLYAGRAAAVLSASGLLFCTAGGGLTAVPDAGALRFSPAELFGVLSAAAGQSLPTHEAQLRQGYLTREGFRIGICGLLPDGRVAPGGLRSLAIRFPYPERISPDAMCRDLILARTGILAAGPPGAGKTTFLKRLLATLATGAAGRYYRTAVIDCREEFAPFVAASPEIVTADVLPAPDKAAGVETAVRLLSPDYLLLDEIGSLAEARRLLEGANAGVFVIASIHARDPAELAARPQFRLLQRAGVFGRAVFLSGDPPGRVTAVLRPAEIPGFSGNQTEKEE